MKILPLLFTLLAISAASAQSGEFATSKDGLIYSDNAVGKLKHIVDSLNLKFRTCESKKYYTKLQGKAVYFSIEGKNAKKAKKDISAGMRPEKLLKKYPEATLSDNLLVVRYNYKDYRNSDVVSFEAIGLYSKRDYELAFYDKESKNVKSVTKGWVFSYHEKSDFSDESLTGFFIDKLNSTKLNDKYSRLVQYSDCLIDTTATVYFKKAKETGVRYPGSNEKIIKFSQYIDDKLKRPEFDIERSIDTSAVEVLDDGIAVDTAFADTTAYVFDDVKYDDFRKRFELWEQNRLMRVDSLMQYDKHFKKMYDDALSLAIDGAEYTNDEFEEYVARYTSKEQALYFKRNRRVIGGCSMDNSPRVHAMNIAELSAETAKWEIFLRSHLDIMNDRFDRVSDGSYAYTHRKTYIKELEVLDINVNDLLLGISIRVGNASENHYYGSINRIGRALSEAKDRELIEKEMLDMIADKNLDDLNRVLMFWLYQNYNHNLEDEKIIVSNNDKLKKAVATMPDYLSKDAEID